MKILEKIKQHPYISAMGIFAVGVLFLMWRGSGSSAGYSISSGGGGVETGSQLAIAQLQAQTAAQQIQGGVNVQNQQTAAAVTIAGLQAQTADNYNNLNAATTATIAGLQAQTQQMISTLQAQVINNQTAAQTQQLQIQAQASYDIAALPYQLAMAQLAASQGTAHVDTSSPVNIPGLNGALTTAYLVDATGKAISNVSSQQIDVGSGYAELLTQGYTPHLTYNANVPANQLHYNIG